MSGKYEDLDPKTLSKQIDTHGERVDKLKAAACVLSDIWMESADRSRIKPPLLIMLTEEAGRQSACLQNMRKALGKKQDACPHKNTSKTGWHGTLHCLDCDLVW